MSTCKEWWKSAVVYQIYPSSFQDSSGNGLGDIPGIIERLDYLAWLGVNALWICPVFKSPLYDFGYDVSDYCDIDPRFGSLGDMEELIKRAHELNLKVILDLIPNHSSFEHPWFQESKSSKDNPKRDWYIWADPKPNGEPPNNWLSRFDGKSAWEWDEPTQQYYLHSYLKEQPDFNWRNPELREAMSQVIHFWYERGVDGFRVDVVHRVMKDQQLRDNPLNISWQEGEDPGLRLEEKYNKDLPETHEFGRWLRKISDQYQDKLLIGEILLPLKQILPYYGKGDEFHLPFNFSMLDVVWDASSVKALVDNYEADLPAGAWPNWVLGNHDRSRVGTRVGAENKRIAMMLLLTLRGTATLYYGDEIGMEDVNISSDRVQDPWEKNVPGLGLGRDPERTPMQWNSKENAGFTAAGLTPWLPLETCFKERNVEKQKQDSSSMLMVTRRLLELRESSAALALGDYIPADSAHQIFSFFRKLNGDQKFVVANFSDRPLKIEFPKGRSSDYSQVFSTQSSVQLPSVGKEDLLEPYEGKIFDYCMK